MKLIDDIKSILNSLPESVTGWNITIDPVRFCDILCELESDRWLQSEQYYYDKSLNFDRCSLSNFVPLSIFTHCDIAPGEVKAYKKRNPDLL